MRRSILVAAAVAALGALTPATAGAAGQALRAGSGASAQAEQAAPGGRLWFRRYNGPGDGSDSASSVAVSPDGRRVFVTGTSQDPASQETEYATVAYSAATGKKLWVSRYHGPWNVFDAGPVVASRTRVFVTGTIQDPTGQKAESATVAYSAVTGRQLWVRLYNTPGEMFATSMAVNAAGTAVFVTGSTATVAYRAATGTKLWARRAVGGSVAVNRRGTTVFVTGGYRTVAYNAATGKQRWARFPIPANGVQFGEAIAINAAGTTVFVTGTSQSPAGWATEYTTTAYSASHGTELWARHYTRPGDKSDIASSVVVKPSGTAVFVTGIRGRTQKTADYATVAYVAATGRKMWVRDYSGVAIDNAGSFPEPELAVSPDGTTVYFTGSSGGYLALAYSAATGRVLWARRYPRNGTDDAASIAVSPRGTAVFVTGTSAGHNGGDYGTVAYRS